MANPFATLLWFLSMASFFGTPLFLWFAIPFILLTGFLISLLFRQPADGRGRLVPMSIVMPAHWIFLGLWGGIFATQPNHPRQYPGWVDIPHFLVPLLFFVAAWFFIWKLSGARLLVAIYAAINLYFLLWMWLLSGMAISGSWL